MIRGPHAGDTRTWFTLRAKLTFWTIAVFLVIQFMLALVIYFYQLQIMSAYFDTRVQARADSVAGKLRVRNCSVTDEELQSLSNDMPDFAIRELWAITLFDRDGAAVASTIRPAPGLDPARRELVLSGGARKTYRAVVPGIRDGIQDEPESRVDLHRIVIEDGTRFVLMVARSDVPYETLIGLAGRMLLLTVPAGLVAAAGAGWFLAGLAIAPLQHLRRIAGSLEPEAIEQEFTTTAARSRDVAAIEAQLQGTREKLIQAFKAQERFISNVSHELKTPISVILTEGQTLPLAELDPRAKAYVLSVSEEMRRLGRTVESFLTLTRVKDGQGLEHARLCPVNDFVMEAVADCSRFAAQHHVSILPSLAEMDPPMAVLGEAELLRVMIDNLLRNAIRFSPQDQQVLVQVADYETECAVLIRDFGPGVPPELIDRLFDRFVQAPDEVRRARGYGLGLSIAQGIAELHSGRISVRNIETGGCEFKVLLPVIEAGSQGTES